MYYPEIVEREKRSKQRSTDHTNSAINIKNIL